MTITLEHLWLFICCGLVTLIPRVLPFLVVRQLKLPAVMIRWLSYIPVCILTALITQSLFKENNQTVFVDRAQLIIIVPTFCIAWFSKSLAITVLLGVAMMYCYLSWMS